MSENIQKQSDRWWETGVIYQIYPLTFADANGDGNGDLQGIIKRLDYLGNERENGNNSLGIDAIWLSPINDSPMIDNGYDVSNYYDICPVFGTLEDFEILLTQCHQRDIRVILDLVVNHTSDRPGSSNYFINGKGNTRTLLRSRDWHGRLFKHSSRTKARFCCS